jgi:hypothetical protein
VTTVAYRDGVIAADRRIGGWMNGPKLFRLKDGSVFSGAGDLDDVLEVLHWLKAGAKEAGKPALADVPDGSDFLLACPNGKAYWLTSPWLRRVEILDEFYAIGSGAQYALGAMAAGASAKRAVEVACKFDEGTGKGVNVIRVKKA